MRISATSRPGQIKGQGATANLVGKVAVCAAVAIGLSACAGSATLSSTRIGLPGEAFGIAAEPDGRTVFVALRAGLTGGSAIAVLRAQGVGFALAQLDRIGGYAAGLSLSHDGSMLAIARNSDLIVVDTATLRAGNPLKAHILPDLNGAIETAFSPDDSTLAVSEENAGQVRLVGPGFRGGSAIVPVGVAPVGLAFSPDGSTLYVTSESVSLDRQRAGSHATCGGDPLGTVSSIDIATGTLRASVPVGCSPVRIVLTRDGKHAAVTLRGQNLVALYATADLRAGHAAPLGIIRVGKAPVGIAFSPDERTLLVADSARFGGGESALSCLAIDQAGALRALLYTPTGAFPREVVALPDGRFLVGLFGGEAVQIAPPCNQPPTASARSNGAPPAHP